MSELPNVVTPSMDVRQAIRAIRTAYGVSLVVWPAKRHLGNDDWSDVWYVDVLYEIEREELNNFGRDYFPRVPDDVIGLGEQMVYAIMEWEANLDRWMRL